MAAERAAHMKELRSCIIYSCVVGSRAYGLDDESSDTDWREVCLPPANLHRGLFGAPAAAAHEPGNPAANPRLQRAVAAPSRPLFFATTSGANQYDFSSADNDLDLRGVHLLPSEKPVGL